MPSEIDELIEELALAIDDTADRDVYADVHNELRSVAARYRGDDE